MVGHFWEGMMAQQGGDRCHQCLACFATAMTGWLQITLAAYCDALDVVVVLAAYQRGENGAMLDKADKDETSARAG